MLKKSLLFLCACLVFVFSFYLIKVDAYSYYGVDFGDYDSYTDSDYGYSTTYTISDYDLENNSMFGSNAYYTGCTMHGRDEKCYNIIDDDPIVNFVPKSLFTSIGVTTHVGEEYGFFVDCHNLLNSVTGPIDGIYEVDVFVFDIKVEAMNVTFSVRVAPLYTYTYIYVDSSFANLSTTNPVGVRLNVPVYDDFYYIDCKDTDLNNNKASSEGLVAPYPYSDVNPNPDYNEIDYCSREIAKMYENYYVIEDVYNYVYAENINYYNLGDPEYDIFNDEGFAFKKGIIEFEAGQPKDKPLSQEQFLSNGIKNICFSKIYDIFEGEIIEVFDELAYLDAIIELVQLLKNNYENNKKIEDYLNNSFNSLSNKDFIINANGAETSERDVDIIDGELSKSMFFYFKGDKENFDALLTTSSEKQEYIYFTYEGYFDNEKKETLMHYILEVTVAKRDDEGNFNSVSHADRTSTMKLNFSTNVDTSTKISLIEDQESLIYTGYFIEGYSETISFDIEEDGLYLFDVNDFDSIVYKNGIIMNEEEYHLVDGDSIKIIVSSNINYGSFSLEITKIIMKTFEIIPDPDYERSGTEYKLYPNESKMEIHIGNTRLLFLGEDAPIDIYDSRLDYIWTSSDPSIATVSKYGTVFARSHGIVTITASIKNRYTAEYSFYVQPPIESSEIKTFSISLDTSLETGVPNGTMISYTPTAEEIAAGYDFGAGGFDIKLGYTRCIFILDGPSKFRQDYDYEVDMFWPESLLPVSVSQYGTIILNNVLNGYIVTAEITCTYKYDPSYKSTFTVRLIGV